MPPLNPHRRTDSQQPSYRTSILPTPNANQHTVSTPYRNTTNPYAQSQLGQSTNMPPPTYPSSSAGGSSASMSTAKQRQYAHLHSQLAQLNANLADTENLLRMTAVQAGDMRFLGGYVGAMFMGSAKVIGEEGVKGQADVDVGGDGEGKESIKMEEDSE